MFNENVNVHIELTDKCNALCSMCGRQYIENGECRSCPSNFYDPANPTNVNSEYVNGSLIKIDGGL